MAFIEQSANYAAYFKARGNPVSHFLSPDKNHMQIIIECGTPEPLPGQAAVKGCQLLLVVKRLFAGECHVTPNTDRPECAHFRRSVFLIDRPV